MTQKIDQPQKILDIYTKFKATVDQEPTSLRDGEVAIFWFNGEPPKEQEFEWTNTKEGTSGKSIKVVMPIKLKDGGKSYKKIARSIASQVIGQWINEGKPEFIRYTARYT